MWSPSQIVSALRRGVVAAAAHAQPVGIPLFLAERALWELTHRPGPAASARWDDALARVRRDGIFVVPGFATAARCEALRAEVDRVLDAESERVHRRGDVRLYGAERASPSVREFHDDPSLLALARALRGASVINGMTLAARLAHTPGLRASSGPGWHRDGWFPQVKAFLFLSDVSPRSGPLELVVGSHRALLRARDMRRYGQRFKQHHFDDDEIRRVIEAEPERHVTAAGPAGTLVIADTSAIHRGRAIEEGTRYALTSYYYPAEEVEALYRYFAPTLYDDR